MNTTRECHFEVTINNTGLEYGITLSGGSDHDTPLYITKVKVDTPAYNCGLKKRDIILAINNINCTHCKHNTAVKLIKLKSNCVKFTIYRSPNTIYSMGNLFEEMKAYVEYKKLNLGTSLSDISDNSDDCNPSNTQQKRSTSELLLTDTEFNSFSPNQPNNIPTSNNVKKGEYTSSKLSLNSFGSEWYKNYATNTVKANQNVTVKDILKLERRKSIQGRSYLKTSTSSPENGTTNHKVKNMVERFNNQPQYITNNITRSPSKPVNGENGKCETHYNGISAMVTTPTEDFLQNPAKYLLSNNSFPFHQSSVYEAVANDNYNSRGPCEITITKGTKLVILRSVDSNWYEGFTGFPNFKIIPKHIVSIDRIVFLNNGIDVQIKPKQQLST